MNHFCVEIEADLRPVGKEQAPDPSVDFDTPDLTPCQHRHREQLSSLQAGGLAVGDLSTVVVTGTASHQQPCQHRSRARRKGIRQNGFAEGLVYATGVEFIAGKVEPVWLRLGGQDVAGERILDRKRVTVCAEPQPELTVEAKIATASGAICENEEASRTSGVAVFARKQQDNALPLLIATSVSSHWINRL